MRIFAITLLLFSLSCLAAQGIDLQSLRLKVAQNPVDRSSRLDLAYQLMHSGASEEALKHYEILLKQDSGNTNAMAGILWALQSQQLFKESIQRADEFLKLQPEAATIYNYQAFALSQTGQHLSARGQYAKAQKLAMDEATRQAATLGLAWEYLFLQNFAAAKSKLIELGQNSDAQAFIYLSKARLKVSLSASSNLDDLHTASLNTAFQKAEWGLQASYEELFLQGSRLRHRMGATADWQHPWGSITASIHTLNGDSQRVYPATQYSTSLQALFYVDRLQFSPSLSGAYSSYQSLDIQQADLGLQISSDNLSGGYSLSLLYRDNDALDSDKTEVLHSFNLGARLYRQSWLFGYLFQGEQAWWKSPYGVTYDDFEANSTAYGLCISSPISRQTGILLCGQIGKHNDKTEYSTSLTLAYHL